MPVKRQLHTPQEIQAVIAELEAQTDRGAAIIAASVAEEFLVIVIQERLMPLASDIRQSLFERPNSPLSSFSAKIDLGFALGMYSETARKHLHVLRDCRNKFAHRVEALHFEHPEIVEIVEKAKVQNPEFLTGFESNRARFMGIFAIVALILIAECGENIRISEVGETRPDIFVELAAKLWPEKAGQLRASLKSQMRTG